jgi:hypothetical protein
MPSDWLERQIDELLLTTATITGLAYARRRARRARRALAKVMIGGAVAAFGAAATAAIAGGLGIAAGARAWYRHRSSAAPTGRRS